MSKNVANEKVQDYVKKSHITTQNEQKSEKNLTEQWKNKELKEDAYYVKLESGKIDLYFMVYDDDDCDEIVEILAPVPSYEQWEKLNWYAGNGIEENQELKMENAKLKELLKNVTDEYDIEKQKVLLKINQLAKLLKEAREKFENLDYAKGLIRRIDEVLK